MIYLDGCLCKRGNLQTRVIRTLKSRHRNYRNYHNFRNPRFVLKKLLQRRLKEDSSVLLSNLRLDLIKLCSTTFWARGGPLGEWRASHVASGDHADRFQVL